MQAFEILHFSDLHLFVDRDGNLRPPEERAVIIRAIDVTSRKLKIPQNLQAGLYHHSAPVLDAFLTTMDDLFAPGRPPRLVMQSGDVEAYGILGKYFHGHDFLDDRKRRWLKQSALWVDVFGNHDVWPGTLPLLGQARTNHVELELRKRAAYLDVMPDVRIVRLQVDPTIRLEIYRLNTVCPDSARNLLALGRLNQDVLLGQRDYPMSRSADPMKELQAWAAHLQRRSDATEIPMRIVVLRHPPRGSIGNPGDVFEQLTSGEPRFHMFLAGHTHKLDPKLNSPYGGAGSIQFVTGTATRRVHAREEAPSFSLYRFDIDTPAGIEVRRTVYRIKTRLDSRFVPQKIEPIGRIDL